MSKPLIIGDEIYNYPTTGEANYGEEATGWAEAATGVIAEVSGPGDIPTTETTLVGVLASGRYDGDITGLSFDTAYVQSIEVRGHITRTFTDATPTQVEYFNVEGAYNGTVINFSEDFSGDDTELEFSTNGGQFRFSYLEIHPDQVTDDMGGTVDTTDTVTIKYSASVKVDESFFA